ncbi:MAG TPA: 50S ribosomal protein L19 [Candidatus Bathyarchaeia archaeon]|nr:50S ribosomal protein L19 [Candidatus Bathyarchaeia archaeon]
MANRSRIKGELVNVGDLITVSFRLVEVGKTRLSRFDGLVIAIKGRGENTVFVVRKIGTGAVGIERIWPINSPWIEKVEVKKRGNVRRAKLYYLRGRKGKAASKVKAKHERMVMKIKPKIKEERIEREAVRKNRRTSRRQVSSK